MKLAVVESPYRAGSDFELARNLAYARALCEHVTRRGYTPWASHLLLTQFLDDRDIEHRKLGIEAGLTMLRFADLHAFGMDLGLSDGMRNALAIAKFGQVPVAELSLPEWADAVASGVPSQMLELIERYQPKWHVHV